MPRLTISLPKISYNRISSLAVQEQDSMSNMINRLVELGLYQLSESQGLEAKNNPAEEHCQQLIIQMNALVKNLSSALLKYEQEDFEKLRLASLAKYNNLLARN